MVWLPDYLWGIETRTRIFVWRRNPFGFQTTYEELKLAREWPSPPDTAASRLPMRNWNLSFSMSSAWFASGFQTTYEELKRNFCPWRIRARCGFQTTYEELKHGDGNSGFDIGDRLPDYLWGIETHLKYDEESLSRASRLPMRNWNLIRGWCNLVLRKASRLPMRNWNSTSIAGESNFARLPDYLWGIETGQLGLDDTTTRELPDYLWGIETQC